MKTLIKDATLIYPGHKMNGKRVTLSVQNGTIKSINPSNADAKTVIDAKGCMLFPGLVDSQCQVGEPGFEDREDFNSLTLAAQAGGFSRVLLLPHTEPVIDSKSEVSFIEKASGLNNVKMHVIGAISKELAGQELSEMYDMHKAGAVAFSDGKFPVSDVNMMKRALEYAKSFGGLISSFPKDDRVSPGGMVNESSHNTTLGLKSTPELAEELMLNRDIYLLKYTQSRLHVSSISSQGSAKLIQNAKRNAVSISSGVSLAHLLYNEEKLSTFDTNFKVTPPLRTERDRKALIKAVKSGVIDVIHTDHTPENIEHKDIEFDQAAYGMTMLETALSAINTHLSEALSWQEVIQAMSINPRTVFRLPMPALEEGAPFEFTLFDPKLKWNYAAKEVKSKSLNSPFLNQDLVGKVVVIA